MDREKDAKLMDSTSSTSTTTTTTNLKRIDLLDDKSDELLETPQISSFKHENIFAQAFKQSTSTTSTTATLQRLASLSALIPSDMEPPTINEIIQSNGVLLSPAPPPPPPPLLSQQPSIDVPSTFKSAAPKKAILFRTTSQNDAETAAMKMNNTGGGMNNSDGKDINNNNNNNGVKFNGGIEVVNDPKYNVPLIDQLESKIDFNLKSNVLVAGKIVDQTTLQGAHGNSSTNSLLNTLSELSAARLGSAGNIASGDGGNNTNSNNNGMDMNLKSEPIMVNNELLKAAGTLSESAQLQQQQQQQQQQHLQLILPAPTANQTTAAAAAKPHHHAGGGHRGNVKAMNIAEKMKRIEKNLISATTGAAGTGAGGAAIAASGSLVAATLMSTNSNDSFLQNNDSMMSMSTSSNDEMVSSSDQNQAKPKKRRLMEMNSDARKEQIRSSNREAARRCRERRRNYIELLENKIKNLEMTLRETQKENVNLKKQLEQKNNGGINMGGAAQAVTAYAITPTNSNLNTSTGLQESSLGGAKSDWQQLNTTPSQATTYLQIGTASNANSAFNSQQAALTAAAAMMNAQMKQQQQQQQQQQQTSNQLTYMPVMTNGGILTSGQDNKSMNLGGSLLAMTAPSEYGHPSIYQMPPAAATTTTQTTTTTTIRQHGSMNAGTTNNPQLMQLLGTESMLKSSTATAAK